MFRKGFVGGNVIARDILSPTLDESGSTTLLRKTKWCIEKHPT